MGTLDLPRRSHGFGVCECVCGLEGGVCIVLCFEPSCVFTCAVRRSGSTRHRKVPRGCIADVRVFPDADVGVRRTGARYRGASFPETGEKEKEKEKENDKTIPSLADITRPAIHVALRKQDKRTVRRPRIVIRRVTDVRARARPALFRVQCRRTCAHLWVITRNDRGEHWREETTRGAVCRPRRFRK